MLYNVAQLMKSPVGETRHYAIDEPFGPCDDVPFASNARGNVQLTRINQGIIARASLASTVVLECSRCLEPYRQELDLSFEERFVPTLDIATGLPLLQGEDAGEDEDVYTIDEHHHLDLHEAVRQQALLNIPMQPLHARDCAGLCPTCGANRNVTPCRCADSAAVDPRLTYLRVWFGEP